MTDAVNLNTNVAATTQVPAATNTTSISNPVNNNSIWSGSDPFNLGLNTNSNSVFSSPLQSNSNFQDDIMMSGLDFNSLSYDPNTQSIVKTVPQQQAQNIPQQAVPATQQNNEAQNISMQGATQPQQQTPNLSELDNYLVPKDQTQNSNGISWKAGGAIIGALTPLAEKLISAIKNPSVLKAINWKQMAVTCPIIGLAGFGIGSLLSNIFGKNNTQAQQQVAQAPQQSVVQEQQTQLTPEQQAIAQQALQQAA